MKKRTDVDFSDHSHKIDYFENDQGEKIRVDKLQKGNSLMNYIEFINTDKILTVTGDFGNWVFCRPFIPSENGYVSDIYWIEKLQTASEQRFQNLDFTEIIKDIEEYINSDLEEDGYEGDKLEILKSWFEELLDVAKNCDEIEYLYKAFRDPFSPVLDDEIIPYYKKKPVWLNIVFDAFEEMCNRLKNE